MAKSTSVVAEKNFESGYDDFCSDQDHFWNDWVTVLVADNSLFVSKINFCSGFDNF